MAYTGSVELISGLTQKNGGTFALVDASAVRVDDETRLDEALENLSGGLSTEAAALLVSILQEALYSSDQTDNIAQLADLLGVGESEGRLAAPEIYLETQLATPEIYLETQLATPEIYLEASTTAVLGVAILGTMVLGDNTGATVLAAPTIELVSVVTQLARPTITLEEG